MSLRNSLRWFLYPLTGGIQLTHEDLAEPMKIEDVVAIQDDNDFYLADDMSDRKYLVRALALHDTDTIMLVAVNDDEADQYLATHASKLHFTHFYKYQKNKDENRIVMRTDKGSQVEIILEPNSI